MRLIHRDGGVKRGEGIIPHGREEEGEQEEEEE